MGFCCCCIFLPKQTGCDYFAINQEQRSAGARGQNSRLVPGPATLSLGGAVSTPPTTPQPSESFLAGPQPLAGWGGGHPHPLSGYHRGDTPRGVLVGSLGEQPFWSSVTPSSETGPGPCPAQGRAVPREWQQGDAGSMGRGVPTAERAPNPPQHTKQMIFTSTEPESLTAKRDLW